MARPVGPAWLRRDAFGCALLGVLLLRGPGLPAHADEPGAPEDRKTLERVVVTGSRILRPDFESASPLVSVEAEGFETTGAPTVEATLNKLPQFVPSFDSTSNNPSANGQAQLDLRGLGPEATLVLLDGRRLTPSTGTGVADVNIIPPTLIERVEIVTGGASAVYGSDAVAGVVNFRLKPYFEGVEIGGSKARTAESDGEQWDANITAGTRFADGRGSVYGFASRSERELLTYDDRAFSRYALSYVGEGEGSTGPGNGFIPFGSAIIEEGGAFLFTSGGEAMSQAVFDALFESYGFPPGSVPFNSRLGFNADGTLFTRGTGAPGSVVNFRGEQDPRLFSDRRYSYNFAPANALQLPLERTSLFGRGTFDITPSTRLFADALYADYSVTQQLAPTPADFEFMPASNPFIPADLAILLASRPDPSADFFWQKRLSVLGPRLAQADYLTYQATAGFNSDVFHVWRLDAYVQHGESEQRNRQQAMRCGRGSRS